MTRHYNYILKSDPGCSHIGQTKDLEDRLTRHTYNRSKATKKRPVCTVYLGNKIASVYVSLSKIAKIVEFYAWN